MNLYEHTIITKQNVSTTQIKQLVEKYSKIVEKLPGPFVPGPFVLSRKQANVVTIAATTAAAPHPVGGGDEDHEAPLCSLSLGTSFCF